LQVAEFEVQVGDFQFDLSSNHAICALRWRPPPTSPLSCTASLLANMMVCTALQDRQAFQAFGKESILTIGAEHFETDWEQQWRTRLADLDRGSSTGGCAKVHWGTSGLNQLPG
jgi:hypothetical protein